MTASDWSRAEVEATVTDYLTMLHAHLQGERYSKTEHRNRLTDILNGRTPAAVEYKHRNISAILNALGRPALPGYKPLPHYQGLLNDVVVERLDAFKALESLVASEVSASATIPEVDDILAAFGPPPSPSAKTTYARERRRFLVGDGVSRPTVNYLEREARNSSLGLAGEEFVIRFEQARLIHAGRERLANKVEHIARTRGDGFGFDVLSYEESGEERLIEVKTTRYAKETPFFVSRTEVDVSELERERYHLYRCFHFSRKPRLFSLTGALSRSCSLDPVTYQAAVA